MAEGTYLTTTFRDKDKVKECPANRGIARKTYRGDGGDQSHGADSGSGTVLPSMRKTGGAARAK
jgi:hypothetical protein